MGVFNSILTLFFLIPSPLFAGNFEGLDAQLKTKAQSELQLPQTPTDTSEPLATVQVILEPFQPKKSVLWGFHVGHNRVSVSGQTNLEFIQPQDLSESADFSLWYVKLARHQLISSSSFLKSWYTGGELGLGSTDTSATTESGLPIEDLRLQMIRARLNAGLEIPIGNSSWALVPQASYGMMNLTQVSSNSAARFSENQTVASGAALIQWQLSSGLMKVGFEQSFFQNTNLVNVSDQTWVFELGYRL